jgi:PRTRC genetic system protein A
VVLVDYLVARAGVPPRRGSAYDYVLAGDGLYLAAENPYLRVRAPVARCTVRGLPPIYPTFGLTHGLIPHEFWEAIVELARRWAARGTEVLAVVTYDEGCGYRLVLPHQIVGPEFVEYRPPWGPVLQIHSHRGYPARFSRTDDVDEQGLCVYGVVGHLDQPRPAVALRAGAYGHFLMVPWESVFAGDRGAFRDVNFEPAGDEQSDHDLPD